MIWRGTCSTRSCGFWADRIRSRSFLRHDDDIAPGFSDNTLGVFEYDRAMAIVDIAAMESPSAGAALRGVRHGGLGDHGALRAS